MSFHFVTNKEEMLIIYRRQRSSAASKYQCSEDKICSDAEVKALKGCKCPQNSRPWKEKERTDTGKYVFKHLPDPGLPDVVKANSSEGFERELDKCLEENTSVIGHSHWPKHIAKTHWPFWLCETSRFSGRLPVSIRCSEAKAGQGYDNKAGETEGRKRQ